MAVQIVSSGVVSSSVMLESGDGLLILSGGIASSTTLFSGSVEVISSGGIAAGNEVEGSKNPLVLRAAL
ncbi:hypothetical protein GOB82_08350 [Acetobacter farinalis]|nr:hypothetical protein [Acetobacter farinalis]